MTQINNSKILIISTNGFEQSELETPQEQLSKAGATVHVASPDGKAIKGWDGGDWGNSVDADLKVADVDVSSYDALVLPGGLINPDILRMNNDVIKIIQQFVNDGKVVAAICHGPWLLIEAGVVKGREMTCFKSIRTDLMNAGAIVVDKKVAVSNGIITSRNPDDLDAFCDKIIEEVCEGQHARAA